MAIDQKERKNIRFFTGIEVENTICKGKLNLFVVGIQPVEEILELAEFMQVENIYFGTSQSFVLDDDGDDTWMKWDEMMKQCLDKDYWVTLDFDISYVNQVLEFMSIEYKKFIPMISAKLPYINQLGYNAVLKLDDNTWGDTNSGVWTHHLHSLMNMESYTHWGEYIQDTPIRDLD